MIIKVDLNNVETVEIEIDDTLTEDILKRWRLYEEERHDEAPQLRVDERIQEAVDKAKGEGYEVTDWSIDDSFIPDELAIKYSDVL